VNFLADENVDQQIVSRLRERGHHVIYVLDMERGVSDDVVLQLCNKSKSLLLTADKDFGELIFRQGRIVSGVVLIRLAGLTPESKAEIVAAAIEKRAGELAGAFAVISPGTVRIRPQIP
jgi:predicted nuclease of predicted toxin-antitoxin system